MEGYHHLSPAYMRRPILTMGAQLEQSVNRFRPKPVPSRTRTRTNEEEEEQYKHTQRAHLKK